MARRAAKSTRAPRGGKGKSKPVEADLQVIQEEDAAPKPGPGIEMGLVIVTLISLLVAFVMIYTRMKSSFGVGWPV